MLGAWLLASLGCDDSSDAIAELDRRGERALQGSQDHLANAVQMIEHVEDFDHQQASALVLTQLGQWIEDQPPNQSWTADPLTATLPSDQFGVDFLSRNQFSLFDFYALREAIWLRNIARWQAKEKVELRTQRQNEMSRLKDEIRALQAKPAAEADQPETMRKLAALQRRLQGAQRQLDPPWLASVNVGGDAKLYDDLTTATQLFDWTVRNIQLLPTHWDAQMPAAAPAKAEATKSETKDDEQEAAPAPAGAEHLVWQALLMGRADAATRARIFVLLARQQEIDVVLLGLPAAKPEDEPRVWAAAALIGDALYLFELELGLPFPGPEGQGICTLAQLKANPELLRQLDIDQHPYRITAKDVERSIVLIDATPDYLSQRMKMVEDNLRSDQRIVLTVEPSQLARRLRKLGVNESRIWNVPYRAYNYQNWRRASAPAAESALTEQFSVYEGPLWAARLHHFRGELDSRRDRLGARARYFRARESKDKIAEFFAKLPAESGDTQSQQAAMIRRAVIDSKRQATYWLGIAAAEEQQLSTAADYLQKRILQADPASPWADGARYNLGRAYEASGDFDQAIALYEADQSPQRHGNLLRAKWLKSDGD
jgi:hypothetical protein